jgi:hypothetical protein
MLKTSQKIYNKVLPSQVKKSSVTSTPVVKKPSKYSNRYLSSEFSETDRSMEDINGQYKQLIDELKTLMTKRKDVYLKKEGRFETNLNKAIKLGNKNRIKTVQERLLREKKRYENERLNDNILLDLLTSNKRVMDDDYQRMKDLQSQLYTANEMSNDTAVNMMEKKIDEEIAKCEIVCSNCHRIRTHMRKIKKTKTA